MSEKAFENKIKKFLKEQDCWCLKTWGGGMQRSGIPDLIICCNGYFLGVEVKAEKGKPSKLQLHEIEQIKKARGHAMILYPKDFEDFKNIIIDMKKKVDK